MIRDIPLLVSTYAFPAAKEMILFVIFLRDFVCVHPRKTLSLVGDFFVSDFSC